MRKMLKDGSLDILIAKEEACEDEDLEVQRVGTLHQCFIASEYFSELKNRTILLKDLDEYPILLQKNPSTTRESFDNFCKEHNIEITTKLEIASATLLEDFVKIGLGVGLATREFAEKDIKEGSIFEVKTNPTIPTIPFALITLKNSFHSFGTNKLIEMILNDNKNKL